MLTHLDIGRDGEDRAAEYLRSIGYAIVERNKRYSIGEIDILAKDGKVLVLVEVKAGRTGEYGYAFERVGSQKKRKLRALAGCVQQEYPNAQIRIDIINVDDVGAVLHFPSAVESL